MATKHWMGSKIDDCQQCGQMIGGVFFDCSVSGQWMIICLECFKNLGCRVGTGLGQRYQRTLGDRFMKVEG